jgi:hypothetical protein
MTYEINIAVVQEWFLTEIMNTDCYFDHNHTTISYTEGYFINQNSLILDMLFILSFS